jgi:hypothetical protein
MRPSKALRASGRASHTRATGALQLQLDALEVHQASIVARRMRPRTFVEALRANASSERGFRFLKEGEGAGEPLSYAALDRRARALATLLRERGAAGERVLLPLAAGLDFVAALFGCFYSGALAVPLPAPEAARPEPGIQALERIARDCGARFSFLPLPGLEWIDVASADSARGRSLDAAAARGGRPRAHPVHLRLDVGAEGRGRAPLQPDRERARDPAGLRRRPRLARRLLAAALSRHGPDGRTPGTGAAGCGHAVDAAASVPAAARCAGCRRSATRARPPAAAPTSPTSS